MSKKAAAVDHILKKYPDLLTTLDAAIAARPSPKKVLRSRTSASRSSQRFKQFCKLREGRPLDRGLFACPLCRNVLEAPVTVDCGHTFCRSCLGADGRCFQCRTDVENAKATNILVKDIVDKLKERKKTDEQVPIAPEPRYCLRSRCKAPWTVAEAKVTVSDLECILCSQCLLDPVTTTCGHTFCRECLARVLDHGLACPLCMVPLETKEQHRGETSVLDRALRLLAPEEHEERLALSRRLLANFEDELLVPIFICTNAFPKVACPLYVYEPRYRLLARRCLQSKTKRFGMAAKTTADKFAIFGTLLEIRDCVNLHDGTSILTTIGLRRFKVLNRGEQDGYDTAQIQYIRDGSVSKEKLPGLQDLHARVLKKTQRWLATLKKRLLAEIERCIGQMPAIENNWVVLPDGPSWTWWLIAILPLSLQLRVGFLASVTLEKRLLAIERMLDHLKIRTRALEQSSPFNCNGSPHAAPDSCSTFAA